MLLAIFSEYGVDQLADTHRRLGLDVQFLACLAQLIDSHALDIHTGIFLNGFKNRQPAVAGLEVDLPVADLHDGGAVQLEGDLFEHLLHEVHHPDVVLVGHVDLHTGELRVVGLVHTLVAEVLGELIDTVVATHDQSLEVELVGDSHIEVDVQGVVVGDERTGRGASRDGLKDRGLDLKAAGGVEIFPHRGDDLRPLDEHVPYLRVDDEVNVPLAVAELRIGEGVIDNAVHLLHDRENLQGLAQDGEFLGMDAELAGLGDEGESLDADDVTDVKEFLPDSVVHCLVLARADLVPLDVDLDSPCRVLYLAEGGRAHDSAGHQAARYADLLEVAFLRIESRLDLLGGRVDRIEWSRIRIDAQFP